MPVRSILLWRFAIGTHSVVVQAWDSTGACIQNAADHPCAVDKAPDDKRSRPPFQVRGLFLEFLNLIGLKLQPALITCSKHKGQFLWLVDQDIRRSIFQGMRRQAVGYTDGNKSRSCGP